jgi:phosphate transport system substrate-binding protein
MKKMWGSLLFVSVVFFTTACKNETKITSEDSPTAGTIHISVDESFKPVMEQQIKVFPEYKN